MLRRFAIRHFRGGFLDRKMTAYLNGESGDLFFFLDGPLDLLEVCNKERGVFRKECGLEGKLTRKGNEDNKEWW